MYKITTIDPHLNVVLEPNHTEWQVIIVPDTMAECQTELFSTNKQWKIT